MESEAPLRLNGYLLEWPFGPLNRSHLLQCGGTTFQELVGISKWEKYNYISKNPLSNEKKRGIDGPYRYTVVCRRSGQRMAILSSSRGIVDGFVDQLTKEVLAMRMQRVAIAVDSLVKSLSRRPTAYCLSYAYARVPAFGTALRNASFFGDDLGEASWFRESTSLMTFYQCGLRSVVGGQEIVKFGSDGALSFNLNSPNKVLKIEEVLSFLRNESYLAADVFLDQEGN